MRRRAVLSGGAALLAALPLAPPAAALHYEPGHARRRGSGGQGVRDRRHPPDRRGGLTGGTPWQALGDTYAYDPRADRWTPLTPLPAGPGGVQDTVDPVSSYDLTTGCWELLPRLPGARDHAGGAVVGSVLYVVGGRDRGQDHIRGDVFALDLRTRSWGHRAPMPTPRGGIAAAAVGSVIYTFGGEGNPADRSHGVFPDTEAYDTARDRWHRLPPMPVPRSTFTTAIALGGTPPPCRERRCCQRPPPSLTGHIVVVAADDVRRVRLEQQGDGTHLGREQIAFLGFGRGRVTGKLKVGAARGAGGPDREGGWRCRADPHRRDPTGRPTGPVRAGRRAMRPTRRTRQQRRSRHDLASRLSMISVSTSGAKWSTST